MRLDDASQEVPYGITLYIRLRLRFSMCTFAENVYYHSRHEIFNEVLYFVQSQLVLLSHITYLHSI
jgi:hypothetical protein